MMFTEWTIAELLADGLIDARSSLMGLKPTLVDFISTVRRPSRGGPLSAGRNGEASSKAPSGNRGLTCGGPMWRADRYLTSDGAYAGRTFRWRFCENAEALYFYLVAIYTLEWYLFEGPPGRLDRALRREDVTKRSGRQSFSKLLMTVHVVSHGTVSAAIRAAAEGDIVELSPGIYNESVLLDKLQSGKCSTGLYAYYGAGIHAAAV
ncbi:hypothetical protein CYMTET_48260 [Cymbomonas tetramitiformis]|uniref:Uncharacterized protein n=1 Tax=Cymbomonas tetramitiformis TaxID=36881 RepID=A0AAE0BUG1_9CHLO|nr:hypothetical protein CYMTET_48260 [Cymbomonas tetramitiformis]